MAFPAVSGLQSRCSPLRGAIELFVEQVIFLSAAMRRKLVSESQLRGKLRANKSDMLSRFGLHKNFGAHIRCKPGFYLL